MEWGAYGQASKGRTLHIELPRIIAHNILWRNARFSQKEKRVPEDTEKGGLSTVSHGNWTGQVSGKKKKNPRRRAVRSLIPVGMDKLT
jgi:hypothetical protein